MSPEALLLPSAEDAAIEELLAVESVLAVLDERSVSEVEAIEPLALPEPDAAPVALIEPLVEAGVVPLDVASLGLEDDALLLSELFVVLLLLIEVEVLFCDVLLEGCEEVAPTDPDVEVVPESPNESAFVAVFAEVVLFAAVVLLVAVVLLSVEL